MVTHMWVRPALLVVLLLEGIAAAVGAVLTLVIGEAITPGYVPWRAAIGPAAFAAVFLGTAIWWWRRLPGGRALAVASQALVVIGFAVVLATSTSWGTVGGLLLGLAGLGLALADARSGSTVV
jgi:hypothetical protein